MSRRSGEAAKADLRNGLICALLVDSMEKNFVYILRSQRNPSRHYVGITSDIRERLEWHNHGPSGHTLSDRPGRLSFRLNFQMNVLRFASKSI